MVQTGAPVPEIKRCQVTVYWPGGVVVQHDLVFRYRDDGNVVFVRAGGDAGDALQIGLAVPVHDRPVTRLVRSDRHSCAVSANVTNTSLLVFAHRTHLMTQESQLDCYLDFVFS